MMGEELTRTMLTIVTATRRMFTQRLMMDILNNYVHVESFTRELAEA